jgi:hypothetical protein
VVSFRVVAWLRFRVWLVAGDLESLTPERGELQVAG